MSRITVTQADRQMFAAVGAGTTVTVFAWLMWSGDTLPAALVLAAGLAVATVLGVRAWRRQVLADRKAVPTRRGWSAAELKVKLLNPPTVGFDGRIDVDLDAGTAMVSPTAGACETTAVLPSPVPRTPPVDTEPAAEQAAEIQAEMPAAVDWAGMRAWFDADVAIEMDHMSALLGAKEVTDA